MAIASAVPSSSASRQAAASATDRSGGLTRSDEAYGAATIERRSSAHGSPLASHAQRRAPASHSSVSARWCGVTSQVTGSPLAFARRTRSSEPAVERWVRCSRAPGTSRTTSARIARSRATAASSAAAGQPRSPSTVATNPSFASAPCGQASHPRHARRSAARAPRHTRARSGTSSAVATGAPSSVKPTTPASASSPSAARVSPARPALIGAPREQPDRRARRGRRATDCVEDGGIVESRRRVRHRADRREPAVRGRCKTGGDRLGVLVARLAQMDVKVDEPRRDDHASLVDRRPPRRALEPGQRLEDAVGDDDLARTLATRRRIDKPRPRDLEVGNDRADLARGRRDDAHESRTPASRYSSAIRTATPLRTCSSITETGRPPRRPARSRRPRSSGRGA